MKCSATCQYLIREDDTSGGLGGVEADKTKYSCGLRWPTTPFLCSVGFGEEPTNECIQGFDKAPEGPRLITQSMLEARELDNEFRSRDLEAGLPTDLYGS